MRHCRFRLPAHQHGVYAAIHYAVASDVSSLALPEELVDGGADDDTGAVSGWTCESRRCRFMGVPAAAWATAMRGFDVEDAILVRLPVPFRDDPDPPCARFLSREQGMSDMVQNRRDSRRTVS